MRKNNTAIIFGGLFFSCSVMAANGTLSPTVVPMVNGGQASIAISNTSPNLFTVPGDRIIAVNSLDGALTNNEQTASGGVVVATVNKKPFAGLSERKVQFTYTDVLARTVGILPPENGVIERARAGIDEAISREQLIPLDREKGMFTSGIHVLDELSVRALSRDIMKQNRVTVHPEKSVPRTAGYSDDHDRPVTGLAGQPEPLSAGYVPTGDGDGAVEPGDTQS